VTGHSVDMFRFSDLFSPAAYVRHRALYDGILGRSLVWKTIAVVVFGRSLARRFLGRRAEHLTTERLAPGQSIQVIAIGPASRRRKRGRRSPT
jgi:hypothetical protein